uniref:Uncharacterized protein n=1 Tax=Arundo donax TaxID=35708 RepID=A0A0A9G6K2_ARUDO
MGYISVCKSLLVAVWGQWRLLISLVLCSRKPLVRIHLSIRQSDACHHQSSLLEGFHITLMITVSKRPLAIMDKLLKLGLSMTVSLGGLEVLAL